MKRHLLGILALSIGLTASMAQAQSRVIDLNAIFDTGKSLIKSQQVASMSEEDELAVGKEVAAATLGAYPPIKDSGLQHRLNQIGAWVALHFAFERLIKDGKLTANPITGQVAAVSCGLFEGTAVLDLDYPEDSKAQADANFVLTGDGGIVEVQGTAEDKPFSEAQFMELLNLAKKGVGELAHLQRLAIGKA